MIDGEVILFPHRKPRARGNVAGARVHGTFAHHRQRILGQPLRVCVKLEAVPVLLSTVRAEQDTRELRAKFEQDPIVRAMLERFGGKISEVKAAARNSART